MAPLETPRLELDRLLCKEGVDCRSLYELAEEGDLVDFDGDDVREGDRYLE